MYLEKRVEELEKELGELKLIVHELRNTNKIETQNVKKEYTEKIEFEGFLYGKVNRKAKEGDVVIFRNNTSCCARNNKPLKVYLGKFSEIKVKDNNGRHDIDVYSDMFRRTRETVDVYESIKVENNKNKSNNELRAEIIEKAKEFIEESKSSWSAEIVEGKDKGKVEYIHNCYKVKYKRKECSRIVNGASNCEFIINRDKGIVVALLKGIESNRLYAKGIARCHPDDVFNEYIGKAIALGKALKLDVSEFEDSTNPDKLTVGMKIRCRYVKSFKTYDVTIEQIGMTGVTYKEGGFDYLNHLNNNAVIIDDSNANYGGNK